MDQTILKNQLQKFGEYLLVDKGLGEITIEGYSRTMSIALRRMRKLKPSYEQVKKYMIWMYQKKYSYSYIRNTTLAIEHYSNFKKNPMRLGRQKKPKRIIKDTITEAEMAMMLSEAKTIRQKAILTLLAYSGIRNRELCNLRLENVDLGANEVTVLWGKNKKDRVVNISSDCTKTLIDYLKEYRKSESEYLFTTLLHNNQLHTCDLRKIVKITAKRSGIKKRVYPHLFRHSLATNLLLRWGNLTLIQEQLGHVFIESTMVYVQSMRLRTKSEYE